MKSPGVRGEIHTYDQDGTCRRVVTGLPGAAQALLTIPGGGPLAADRKRLPIFNFREQMLETIGASQVLVVQGDTGCGKTTQLPQYLLEQAAEAGSPISIVCTQVCVSL